MTKTLVHPGPNLLLGVRLLAELQDAPIPLMTRLTATYGDSVYFKAAAHQMAQMAWTLSIMQEKYAQAVQRESALRNTPANLANILAPQASVEPIPPVLQIAWQQLGAETYQAAWHSGKELRVSQIFDLSSSILGYPLERN